MFFTSIFHILVEIKNSKHEYNLYLEKCNKKYDINHIRESINNIRILLDNNKCEIKNYLKEVFKKEYMSLVVIFLSILVRIIYLLI